jgi:hypothetical protein
VLEAPDLLIHTWVISQNARGPRQLRQPQTSCHLCIDCLHQMGLQQQLVIVPLETSRDVLYLKGAKLPSTLMRLQKGLQTPCLLSCLNGHAVTQNRKSHSQLPSKGNHSSPLATQTKTPYSPRPWGSRCPPINFSVQCL